jgi:single-stranded-DNA-specific exonuclease
METAKDSFIHYGGHVGAGGFAVDKRHVHDLAEMLQKGIQKAQIEKTEGDVSAHFLLHEPKKEVFTIITQFAPFGMSNEKPIFKSEFTQIISHKLFGKTKEHLEVFFLMNGRTYKGIAFFTTEDNFLRPLVMGETYTVIYSMEMSYFIRPELRLKIIDIY